MDARTRRSVFAGLAVVAVLAVVAALVTIAMAPASAGLLLLASLGVLFLVVAAEVALLIQESRA